MHRIGHALRHAAETVPTGAHSALGQRIRVLRRARGLTQDQLARATGVSRSAVAQWETGRAGFGAKLRVIAEVLEVPARQLQTGASADIPRRFGEAAPISQEELTLLRHFRELDHTDQACLLRVAQKLASALLV